MKKIKISINAILAITIFQLMFTGCCNYYKAISTPVKSNADAIVKLDSLKRANRTFILRNGEEAFYMGNPVLNPGQKKLECTLGTLESFNTLHLTSGKNGKMRYKKSNPSDLSVLNEAHIYITRDSAALLGKYNLALDKVQKIEVIEKDKQRTYTSYILGGIGITAGIFVIAGAIFASTYSFDFGGH